MICESRLTKYQAISPQTRIGRRKAGLGVRYLLKQSAKKNKLLMSHNYLETNANRLLICLIEAKRLKKKNSY